MTMRELKRGDTVSLRGNVMVKKGDTVVVNGYVYGALVKRVKGNTALVEYRDPSKGLVKQWVSFSELQRQ